MNTRNRAKFRIQGISFEQAVVAYLTRHPGSTAEQINSFVQHPEFKNFSTILSAMKFHGQLTRTGDRPAKWSVSQHSNIQVPDLDITMEGLGPAPAPESLPSLSEGSTTLETAVQRLAAAKLAVAQATNDFNSLLPNLDDASRQSIFQMMAKGVIPASQGKEETPSQGGGGGSKRIRRSAEAIQEVAGKITELLKQHPEGLRAGQICEELGLEAKELPKPIFEGLASKAFKRRGERRLTTYYIPKVVNGNKATVKKSSVKEAEASSPTAVAS